MPESSLILAPVDPLVAHLLGNEAIRGHLFELFSDEAGFVTPEQGLLVVRVPEAWWRSFGAVRRLGPGVAELGGSVVRGDCPWDRAGGPSLCEDPGLQERYPWLAGVAPPHGLTAWLDAAAKATGAPLAYYHRKEHGDDLYCELALLFDGHGEPALAIRQTFLVDTSDDEDIVLLTAAGRSSAAGSVFARALQHIGSPSRIAYFPPDDDSRFDWEICRVDPDEHR